jgi:hypothetical protein
VGRSLLDRAGSLTLRFRNLRGPPGFAWIAQSRTSESECSDSFWVVHSPHLHSFIYLAGIAVEYYDDRQG